MGDIENIKKKKELNDTVSEVERWLHSGHSI